METVLRRYTEMPYVVDLLQAREIALVNPASWDDRNDSYYIEQYARAKGLSSTYALCMAQAPETYHHWRVFSHGSGGVCIVFDKGKFFRSASKVIGLRAEEVQYKTILEMEAFAPKTKALPFLKRAAYSDEKEFRLFLGVKKKGPMTYRFPISIESIDRIILSPWLPQVVFEAVKRTLKSIKGCDSIRIHRSSLIENERWKSFASNGS